MVVFTIRVPIVTLPFLVPCFIKLDEISPDYLKNQFLGKGFTKGAEKGINTSGNI